MRALLVASTGGHMLELDAWSKRISGLDSVIWAAAESPQSKTLLAGQDIRWIPDIQPRQLRETMSLLGVARRIVSEERIDVVISTGASVAIPFLVAARMYGAEGHYIESAARVEGASITGQVASHMPRVRCYTQSTLWTDPRWTYAGSVFDGYVGQAALPPTGPLRVVVTVGGMHHPMTRLINQLNAALPADAEVVWQLGHTPPVPGMKATRIEEFITHDELTDLMAEADVVVCHAGVGSAMQAMSVGRSPILVPRKAHHGEHVDDHQAQIARRLGDLGVALPIDAESLSADLLTKAASRTVRRQDAPGQLNLRTSRVRSRASRPLTIVLPRTFAESVSQPQA